MQQYDVIVLGAGAAGLMCAITAGQRGRRVLVIERTNRPGKKILMSGGGRCNFTNLNSTADNYLSSNPHFCKSALKRYRPQDFLDLVNRHGIAWHEKEPGQLFCDDSAKPVLTMLLAECEAAGVTLKTDCEVTSVQRNDLYNVATGCGDFRAGSLVVATGGLSIPTLGGTGFGYALARQFGLNVIDTRAGLVPFTLTDSLGGLSDRLSGVSLETTVETGKARYTGMLLFTHRGLSGPAVLQASSHWQPGQEVRIDLFPGEVAGQWLLEQKRKQARALMRSVLAQRLPRKLVRELETMWWPERSETVLAEWPDKALTGLGAQLNQWAIRPAGTEGYRTAEVTLGGVDTRELSSQSMEATRHPGLYFIGEVVDVTGELGGHNFQWAWASGVAAGKAV